MGQGFEGLQSLFGPKPHRDIFGQVAPADSAARIDEEFRRPRDVTVVWAGARMQKIIAPDCGGTRVG